jgi:hypothetical protein
MKSSYIIVAFALLFCSCGNNYEFWDISQFRIDNKALADMEKVRIVYTSQGPYFEEDTPPFYTHLIAISLDSGDTVNILTPKGTAFSLEKTEQIFHFLKQDNVATKLLQMNPDEINNVKNINDLADQPVPVIDKVSQDPKFDFLADNNFPSIIGVIVTFDSNVK